MKTIEIDNFLIVIKQIICITSVTKDGSNFGFMIYLECGKRIDILNHSRMEVTIAREKLIKSINRFYKAEKKIVLPLEIHLVPPTGGSGTQRKNDNELISALKSIAEMNPRTQINTLKCFDLAVSTAKRAIENIEANK